MSQNSEVYLKIIKISEFYTKFQEKFLNKKIIFLYWKTRQKDAKYRKIHSFLDSPHHFEVSLKWHYINTSFYCFFHD